MNNTHITKTTKTINLAMTGTMGFTKDGFLCVFLSGDSHPPMHVERNGLFQLSKFEGLRTTVGYLTKRPLSFRCYSSHTAICI